MNKRRKFFSGYAVFCICWSILSLCLSIFSIFVRLFKNANFNNVSSISLLPGINAGTFINISSIYFLIIAIFAFKENRSGKNMVRTSALSAVLFICQLLVVTLMYSIHKINLRIYIQAVVVVPFLILPLSIMMTELPRTRVSTDLGKRSLFHTLDKVTKKKDISRLLKPRKPGKRK